MLKHLELEKKMLYQQVYHVLMYYLDEAYATQIKQEMENELPLIKGKKVILFALTFRGNGHGTAHYPFFKIDFERLARYCEKHNAVVLFKMHPFVKIDSIFHVNIDNTLSMCQIIVKLTIFSLLQTC